MTIGANYHPKIDPKRFTNHVTNRYFPLVPGKTLHPRGVRDGKPTEHTFAVTRATKVVMGVRSAVISDVVTQSQSLAPPPPHQLAMPTQQRLRRRQKHRPACTRHKLARRGLSRTGFRGDLDSRMLSWGVEILRRHVETEEVPRGAARARCPAGA
jgi:hypothetical protein